MTSHLLREHLPLAPLQALLLFLSVAVLPHQAHHPWWIAVLWLGCAGWRLMAARYGWGVPPSQAIRLVLVIGVGGGILLEYGTLIGRDAGVALLVAMASLKLLESETRRDGTVLVFLGYLVLMAHLLYSQEIPLALYLLASVVPLVACQIVVQTRSPIGLNTSMRLAGRMTLIAVPFMVVLFALFPRLPGPLWGLPDEGRRGLTGLSDSMRPGQISELILSDEVAFRVRFEGDIPHRRNLYWRGPVLERFDDGGWYPRESLPRRALHGILDDTTQADLNYTVLLEPHGQRWVFALEMPLSLPPDTGMNYSYQLMREKPVNELWRYSLQSTLNYRIGSIAEWEQRSNLWLGRDEGNPQAQVLAESWRQQLSPEGRVDAALQLFRQQPFFYTLRPPILPQRDGIDAFLFETRRGFCEHYASAFTFLMRIAGVPARVVTGYQGGEVNQQAGGYLIVRQSDAHAWAEVWLDERGWVRIDPTAAVSPDRIEEGLYASADAPELLPFLARSSALEWLLFEATMRWDAINIFWNEWILAYGPQQQRAFMEMLGFEDVDWPQLIFGLLSTVIGISLALALLQLWQQWRQGDPLQRTFRQFCRRLQRRGLALQPGEGPIDLGQRAAAAFPHSARQIEIICHQYAALRYAPPGRSTLKQLRDSVRTLRL